VQQYSATISTGRFEQGGGGQGEGEEMSLRTKTLPIIHTPLGLPDM